MNRIRVAIQKSGRLSDKSLDLLQRCGLRFARSKDKLYWYGKDFPIDLLLVRDDDIPGLVSDDVCLHRKLAQVGLVAFPAGIALSKLEIHQDALLASLPNKVNHASNPSLIVHYRELNQLRDNPCIIQPTHERFVEVTVWGVIVGPGNALINGLLHFRM